MGFQKGNKHGAVPKAGKGVGPKPKAVTEAKKLELEGLVPDALKVIKLKLAEGDPDMAKWVYEQARGKARQQQEHDGELTIRVLKDGAELTH
jgi:hypothetical protein